MRCQNFSTTQRRYRRVSIKDIEKIIINNPATIIFWNDGTKTVVKCTESDEFDPDVGIAMAIIKRMFDNSGNGMSKWFDANTAKYYGTEAREVDADSHFDTVDEYLAHLAQVLADMKENKQ